MSSNPFMDYQEQFFKMWNDSMEKMMDSEAYKTMAKNIPGSELYAKTLESMVPNVENYWKTLASSMPGMNFFTKSDDKGADPMAAWNDMMSKIPGMDAWKEMMDKMPGMDFWKNAMP